MLSPAGNADSKPPRALDVRCRSANPSNELLHYMCAMVESSDDAILAKSLDGHITYWNAGAEQLYGYTAQEAVGRHISMLTPRELDGQLDAVFARLKKGERLHHFETIRMTKAGQRLEVSLTISPISDDHQQIIGFSSIARDITPQKRLERELIAMKRRADRALLQLENIAEGVLVTDADGRFLLANPGFWRSYGLESGAVHDIDGLEKLVEVFDAEGNPLSRTDWPLTRALKGEGLKQQEYRVRRKNSDGVAIVRQSAVPVYESAQECSMVVHTVEDITAQRSLQERLSQAEKLEAIGQLAGGVAHDMNNYLGCILLQCGLMRASCDNDATQVGYCTEIENVCEQARAVIRQLLAFGRRSLAARVIVDVNKSFASTLAMLQRLIGQSVEISWHLEEPGWRVLSSPGQLSAILLNLAVNARDAMPDGGRLRIETRNVSLAEPTQLNADRVEAGDYIVLEVSDTGTGISAEDLKRIFDPFFTTKADAGGTGLGLSTVYGAVKDIGGSLNVDSAIGVGTTFSIWMPRCTASQAAAVPTITNTRGQQGAILLVEDEPVARTAMSDLLRMKGFDVTAVSSAREALEIFHREPQKFRTIVTDLVMPGMSGRALAESLLTAAPGARIILMSGYDRERTTSELDDRVEFLAKPFEIRELLALLGTSARPA